PNIKSPEVLASALAIHSVEGRHAATLNTLLGESITPDGAFAVPADVKTVLEAVEPFIVG
ncbi:MAG TPA: ferritin-like domain-containing protein, partial [Solirubrobacterales bacterium]